jgi:lipoyl-dependent peroxiredoxin
MPSPGGQSCPPKRPHKTARVCLQSIRPIRQATKERTKATTCRSATNLGGGSICDREVIADQSKDTPTTSKKKHKWRPSHEQGCVHGKNTHTIRGRESGTSRSSDGRLDIKLSTPGTALIGTNPEQLISAAWSASFATAITLAARQRKIVLPADVTNDIEVALHLSDDGYFLSARLRVGMPDVERNVALALVCEAEQICPYCRATRGNIEVAVGLV